MIIRPAQLEDLRQILEIYNEAVLNTTATYDYEPRTLDTGSRGLRIMRLVCFWLGWWNLTAET